MKNSIIPLLSVSCISLMSGPVFAANIYFDNNAGAGDGAWATATNWQGDALPGTADQAFTSADVTVSSSQSVRRILANNGYTVTIASGGTLTTNGSVEVIGDNSIGYVVVQNGGTYNRTSTLDTRFAGSTVTVQA